jgi:hypothetical protein
LNTTALSAVVHRQVDHGVDVGVGRIGAHRARHAGVDPGVVAGGVGLVVDGAHRAALGIGAEQRALGTAQHLDAGDVGQLQVHEEGDVVDVVGHRRSGQIGELALAHADVVGGDAADDEVVVHAGAALAIVGRLQADDLVAQAGERVDAVAAELGAADGGDVVGDLQHALVAAGGGDDQFADGGRRGWLLLRQGAQGGEGERAGEGGTEPQREPVHRVHAPENVPARRWVGVSIGQGMPVIERVSSCLGSARRGAW